MHSYVNKNKEQDIKNKTKMRANTEKTTNMWSRFGYIFIISFVDIYFCTHFIFHPDAQKAPFYENLPNQFSHPYPHLLCLR